MAAPAQDVFTWSSLAGPALVGALTLLGSWIATSRAHALDRTRRNEEQDQQAAQLLRALRAELAVARERYREAIGEEVDKRAEGQTISLFRASENYLTVYESSGEMLGLIRDEATVDKVVRAYTYLRSLLDTHRINNDKHERLDRLKVEGHSERAEAYKDLVAYADKIQQLHHRAMKAVDEAQLAIQQYLREPYSSVE